MPFRTGVLDIETTNLNCNIGRIVTAAIKKDNGKIEGVRISDFPEYKKHPGNDLHIVQRLLELLEPIDIIVGWYSKQPRFDIPFVVGRAMRHGFKLPHELLRKKHVDLYPYAKKWLPLTSRRLQIVGQFLKCPTDKTKIDWDHWTAAIGGSEESVEYIWKHNKHDVKITDEVLERMKPFIGRIQ